jgi:hypothetical protein
MQRFENGAPSPRRKLRLDPSLDPYHQSASQRASAPVPTRSSSHARASHAVETWGAGPGNVGRNTSRHEGVETVNEVRTSEELRHDHVAPFGTQLCDVFDCNPPRLEPRFQRVLGPLFKVPANHVDVGNLDIATSLGEQSFTCPMPADHSAKSTVDGRVHSLNATLLSPLCSVSQSSDPPGQARPPLLKRLRNASA